MNNNYDSILKEKKKYVEQVDDRHFLRRYALLIDLIIIAIILLVSFIIYFHIMFKPINMIYNDFNYFKDEVSVIYKNIFLDYSLDSDYNILGNIDFNVDSNYDYKSDIEFLNGLNLSYNIFSQDNYKFIDIASSLYNINYYETDNQGYINFDDNYVMYDDIYTNIDINDMLDILSNSIYEEVSNLDFKRSIYVSDGKLVVSVSLDITGSDINEMFYNIMNDLGSDSKYKNIVNLIKSKTSDYKIVDDNTKYNISIKNDLFLNDLISFKVIINNESNRGTLTYSDNTFNYKDDNHNNKLVIKIEDNDFSLRFYDNDNMSYILSGKGDDSSYIYNYQVINVIDNFSLQIKKDDNKINYILNIKRDNDDKYLDMLINLSLEYSNSYNNDNSFVSNDYISYDDMNIEDREKVNNYVFKIYYSLYNLLVYNK